MTVAIAAVTAIKAAVPGVKVESVRPLVDPANPPAEKYVVVSVSTGLRSRDRYTATADMAAHRIRVMCVGPHAEEVQNLARRIADHLMVQRISTPGWRCSLPVHDVSREPDRDDAVTARPLIFTIDEFSLTATRI